MMTTSCLATLAVVPALALVARPRFLATREAKPAPVPIAACHFPRS
jgi:hypothetical protein